MVDWKKVTPYDFQKLIGVFYEKSGFEVLVCKLTRDKGVDVLAKKFYPEYGRTYLCVIQAKRYVKKKIGRPDVQKLKGAAESKNADIAVLITTSDFTQEAREEAMKLKNIELMNREKIERNLADVGFIDIEQVDVEADFSDPLIKMRTILQTLKDFTNGTAETKDVLRRMQISLHLDLTEDAFRKLIMKLIKLDRIVPNEGYISYVPSNTEKEEIESDIETTVPTYTFPLDLSFLKMSTSASHNLHPKVVDSSFGLNKILMNCVETARMAMLSSETYISMHTLESIKSRILEKENDLENYDICDLTDDFLTGLIKDSKKYYYNAFKQMAVANSHSLKNFGALSSHLETRLLSKRTLIVSTDFEKFVITDDKRVLEVVEHLAASENGDIYVEDIKQLLKINSDLSEPFLKLVVSKICKKYKSHVSDHKIIVRETAV